MERESREIILVTPVWNDSGRLGRFGPALADALARAALPIHWIIADDGSRGEEQRNLQELVSRFKERYASLGILHSQVRSRKGGAIRLAWESFPHARYLAFVDADGAVSAGETLRLIDRMLELERDCAVVGVREDTPEAPVHRRPSRVWTFLLFKSIVNRLLRSEFTDTQCGAKVICGDDYRRLSPLLRERGFAFDVELMLALKENGVRLEEVPVAWNEREGGKVRPLRDGWGMLRALFRIRRRFMAGHYGLEKRYP